MFIIIDTDGVEDSDIEMQIKRELQQQSLNKLYTLGAVLNKVSSWINEIIQAEEV